MELSQQAITKDDGNFDFETMAESNDANIQTVILADKEELALGWANWYLTKDLDVQIILGRPMVLAGRVVDEFPATGVCEGGRRASFESLRMADIGVAACQDSGELGFGVPGEGIELVGWISTTYPE